MSVINVDYIIFKTNKFINVKFDLTLGFCRRLSPDKTLKTTPSNEHLLIYLFQNIIIIIINTRLYYLKNQCIDEFDVTMRFA